MNDQAFDRFTRQLSLRLNRRRFLQAAAAIPAAAMLPSAVKPATAQTDSPASELVQRYYELIDAYQYETAYGLLGTKWHAQQSLETYTKGFANTAFVQCRTTGEANQGGNTSVAVKLISWHNDGKTTAYSGGYTVGEEGGELRILAGDNSQGPVPSGTAPLCAIDDLAFRSGRGTPAPAIETARSSARTPAMPPACSAARRG